MKRLLPSTLVIANSGAFSLSAAKDVASSGRDVLKARNKVPTKLASHPNSSANVSPVLAKKTAATTTIDAQIMYIKAAFDAVVFA